MTEDEREMVRHAATFAEDAHSGQDRKYTGEPYFTHVQRVAMTVSALPEATPEMVAAAYLHDTVEDTEVTPREIEQGFGAHVAALVVALTNPSKDRPDLRRAERKQLDIDHLAQASRDAQIVKLVDRTDNVLDMKGAPASFQRLYAAESRDLLDVIGEAHSVMAEELDSALSWLEMRAG